MNELKIIESQGLIKVYETETNEKVVNARELHEGLESNTKFADWIARRLKECDAIENEDYIHTSQIWETRTGATTRKEYILKLDTAKEVAMLERNEKGKQYRRYFIDVEKKYKQNLLPSNYKQALQHLLIAVEEKEQLQLENTQQKQLIGELKPKADYTDRILQSKSLLTITQIAKDYGMSATEMNKTLHELGIQYKQSEQWLLYAKYHDRGYTHSKTINITHKDNTQSVKMQTKWTQKGRLFLYEELKKIDVIPKIEMEG